MRFESLRLDEVLRRDVSIEWFEGVAVIQAICRELPDAAIAGAKFPLGVEVAITPEGVVSILRRPSGSPGIVAAGRLLGEMLQTDVPVRLRLIHSEAVATTPAFQSVKDLSAALAYFERPDAQQSIQQLYARAAAKAERHEPVSPTAAAPASLASIEAPPPPSAPALVDLEDFLPETPDPPAPISAPRVEPPHLALVKPDQIPQIFQQPTRAYAQPAHSPEQKEHAAPAEEARKPRAAWIAIAAAIGLSIVVSGALLTGGPESAQPSEEVASPSTTASAPTTGTSAPQRPGTKPVSDLRQSTASRDTGRPEVRLAVPSSRTASGASGLTIVERSTATTTPSTPTSNGTDLVIPDLSWTTRLPLLGRQPLERVSPLPTATDADGQPVYSRANIEIRPPVAIRPHLPSEPPMDYPADHLMVLDLVVTIKGEVESVRLMTVPKTVNDFMIVSAAKAWLFAPAKLNGRAVKYKHRIRFVVP